MELLHSQIDEFQVVCPACQATSQAGRNYQLIQDGRLYRCTVCSKLFEVSKAMFMAAQHMNKVTGIPINQQTETQSAYSSDRHPLIAECERRAAARR